MLHVTFRQRNRVAFRIVPFAKVSPPLENSSRSRVRHAPVPAGDARSRSLYAAGLERPGATCSDASVVGEPVFEPGETAVSLLQSGKGARGQSIWRWPRRKSDHYGCGAAFQMNGVPQGTLWFRFQVRPNSCARHHGWDGRMIRNGCTAEAPFPFHSRARSSWCQPYPGLTPASRPHAGSTCRVGPGRWRLRPRP